nr:hypothetical protein Itr_chr15CG06830 [Ipomoea trifida]
MLKLVSPPPLAAAWIRSFPPFSPTGTGNVQFTTTTVYTRPYPQSGRILWPGIKTESLDSPAGTHSHRGGGSEAALKSGRSAGWGTGLERQLRRSAVERVRGEGMN